jgi:O-antigen/teichoic acid export membrane protein
MVYWTSGNLFIVTAGALLGVTAVGALKAAQSLIGVTHILFQGIENLAPMRAAQSYHAGGGGADLVLYLSRVTRFGLVATGVIALLFAIDPAFWFHLVFGEEFAEYSYILRWYALLYVLMFLTLPLGVGLRAMEMTGPIFLAYVVGAGFSLAAAYPLVSEFGLSGVMVGLLSIQILILAVMTMSFRQALVRRPT